MECALNFYRDFIEPDKQRYAPSDPEREQMRDARRVARSQSEATAEEIEKEIYDLGRRNYDKPGKIFPLTVSGAARPGTRPAPRRVSSGSRRPQRMVEIVDARLA